MFVLATRHVTCPFRQVIMFAGAAHNNAIATWFEMHLQACRTLESQSQDGDRVGAWGIAMPPGFRSQFCSSMDMSKSSNHSGEDATSAPRAADASCTDVPASKMPRRTSDSAERPQSADPCSPVDGPLQLSRQAESAAAGAPTILKQAHSSGECTVQPAPDECSPGRDDSRRSSSTLEGQSVHNKPEACMQT
jgi:hypothetical protein